MSLSPLLGRHHSLPRRRTATLAHFGLRRLHSQSTAISLSPFPSYAAPFHPHGFSPHSKYLFAHASLQISHVHGFDWLTTILGHSSQYTVHSTQTPSACSTRIPSNVPTRIIAASLSSRSPIHCPPSTVHCPLSTVPVTGTLSDDGHAAYPRQVSGDRLQFGRNVIQGGMLCMNLS
jgi:hypothetical protein